MNLSNFFKENVKEAENKKVKISDRFKDEKGEILEWEIKAIANTFDDQLREANIKQVKIKKNTYVPKLDTTNYTRSLLVNCVVFPNLNNKELQESWGVMSAEELITVMLLPGEYNTLLEEVQEICGFNKDILEEKVDEAKN